MGDILPKVVLLCLVIILSSYSVNGDNECFPQNCILSQWTEWSLCSESCGDSGVRNRQRKVLQKELCGGTCGDTKQTEPCNRKCCPKNCAFTEWTKWGSCNCFASRCDQAGERRVCSRFRREISGADCGGFCGKKFEFLCKEPCCYKDCILGAWGSWGSCQAPCESPGLSTRERKLIQSPDCGGKRCKEGKEQKKCMGSCCPVDCVLGPWSEWTECTATCGEADITRSRMIKQAECNGKECKETNTVETKKCSQYNNIDCKMSSWSAWSECSLHNGKCGEGSKTRTRKVITPHECLGEQCSNTTETHVCFGECCRVDCAVGEWTEFGYCSTPCGKGISTKTRKVLTMPECGGTKCPVLSESKDCEVYEATDCSLSQWSQWTACSSQCGKGKRKRSRTLLNPAYCEGKCDNEETDNEEVCESYAAKRDCEVSEWTDWTELCIRDCANGRQYKNRTIIETPHCGGKPCPALMDTRGCHKKCTQLCNQGVCSCHVGYKLEINGYSCKKVECGEPPNLTRCPKGTKPGVSCSKVVTECNGQDYGSVCQGSCSGSWVLKGQSNYTECHEDGEWSKPNYFCGPPNKAPTNMDINATEVSELTGINGCFAKLTTETENESWDRHTYSVIEDPSGTLKIDGDRVCIKVQLDYEKSKYKVWNATIRSSDLDGLHLDKEFAFTLLDNNDPPRSAVLEPNTIPENSLKGTEVGCFILKDDDEGQNLTVVQLTSKDIFQLYQQLDKTYCTRLIGESDPKCPIVGGKHCIMNFEDHPFQYFAVLVVDDGKPPLESYFDIKVELTNVEEPVTGIKASADFIAENLPAGQPFITLTAEDEDEDSTHKYEIVKDTSGLFKIVDDKIVATEMLDYESKPDFDYVLNIRVTETNSKLSSMEQLISFQVKDANERPFNMSISSTNSLESFEDNEPTVKENVADVVVGKLTVSDPDLKDIIQFSVNNENFTLKNSHCSHPKITYCSALLLHKEGFDYETEPTVAVEVTATDKFHVTTKLQLNIDVIDMNDPPTDILIEGNATVNIEIPENSKDYEIATLSIEDQDKDSNPKFFILGPASSLFLIKEKMLKTAKAAVIDFETYEPRQLTIRAEDNGLYLEKTFNLKVLDVNESPIDIIFTETKLKENSAEDTLVSTMSAVDPDKKQTFSYKLIDDAKGRFYVKGNQLFVKKSTQLCGNSICLLNYEEEKEIKIDVEVTDNGSPPLSTIVTQNLLLEDQNDSPYGLTITSFHIAENKPRGSTVGILLASDEDQDTLSFTLLDFTSEFEVIEGNQLISRMVFDHEVKSHYDIKIQVSDDGTPKATFEDSVTIIIDDINDAPQFIGSSKYSVQEGVAIESVIATLTIFDPDENDPADVRLINYDKVFFLTDKKSEPQNDTGTLTTIKLTPEALLDYEQQQAYDIELGIADRDGLKIIHKIRVDVLDVNDQPQEILVDGQLTSSLKVEEGQTKTLGILKAVDQDSGQTHSFVIKSQPLDHFAIEGNLLKLSKALDYEERQSVSIVIEVKDSGEAPLAFGKTFKVQVMNKNEPPSSLQLTSSLVAENSKEGTEIGLLKVEDPDIHDDFDFTLLNGNGLFKIKGEESLVVAKEQCDADDSLSCSLNFENQKSYTIKVLVTDNGFPAQSAEFDLTIDVTDVNDPPSDIVLSGTQVEELAAIDTKIGDLSVSDEDAGQTHTFSLNNVTDDMFKLDESGKVIIKASADRLDTSKIYSLVIDARDSGTPPKSVEKKYFISVLGVSEAPQNITLTASKDAKQVDEVTVSVPETSSTKIVVGTISGEDNDLDQTISFSLLENPDDQFEIGDDKDCKTEDNKQKCTVSLLLSKALNFEAKEKYSLTILALDSENDKISQTVFVQVSDVAEPPKKIIFSKETISVPENSHGVILGTFLTVDEDQQDSHTFSLPVNGDGNFAISSSGTLSVKSDADLNFESKPSFNITVKVTDSTGNILDEMYEINIFDVNEPATGVTLSNSHILENSQKDTLVGFLQTTDPDNINRDEESKQNSQYSLLNDADGRFIIKGSSVLVSAVGSECKQGQCNLDFEKQASYQIQVQIVDSGSPQMTSSFQLTITVDDGNDVPSLSDIDVKQLREDMKAGDEITQLSATDQDKGQEITFTIGEDENDLFKLNGNTLTLAGQLDFEVNPTVSVSVVAKDNGNPPKQMQRTFHFDVTDTPEPPSIMYVQSVEGDDAEVFPQDKPIIGENVEPGSIIAQLIVIDPDNDEEISVIISGNYIAADPPGCLTLTKGTRCVSNIVVKHHLDFEKEKQFAVSITSMDKSQGQLKKDIIFSIKDENDPPQVILINDQDIDVLDVNENVVDHVIATLKSIDPDAEETFSYEVTGSTQFYVVGNELRVASAAQLDHETSPQNSLKIRVTDSGVPPLSIEKQITIRIIDVNEAPEKVSLTRAQVAENSVQGTDIGTFITFDPDNSITSRQTFSYELTEDSDGMFITTTDGELKVQRLGLDFEEKSMHLIKVKVTDSGSPPSSAEFEFKISITDSNDPPFNLKLSGYVVAEDATIGTTIGKLSADEFDKSQTVSFSIDDSNMFAVKDNALVVDGELDFESAPKVTVKVVATDDGIPPMKVSKSFTIFVTDANDAPVELIFLPSAPSNKMEIDEGSSVNHVIGNVKVFDVDAVDQIRLSLTSHSSSIFKFDAAEPKCNYEEGSEKNIFYTVCSLNVLLTDTVKYSSDKNSLILEATATDKGDATSTQKWNIDIVDKNDPPNDITIDEEILEVPENEFRKELGQLHCSDPDKKQKHIFQIITYWDIFKVDENSLLFSTTLLDAEKKPEYEVAIRCIDNGKPEGQFTKVFTIKVKDVNEKPTDILLSHLEVPMTAKTGDTIAVITVMDPDNAGQDKSKQRHTCTIIEDESNSFNISDDSKELLVDGTIPVKKTSVQLKIECKDDGTPQYNFVKIFTLQITENADIPKSIVFHSNGAIDENTQNVDAGYFSVVNDLTEADVKGIFTYYDLTTSDTDVDYLEVTGNKLVVKKPVNFEKYSVLSGTIKVAGHDLKNNEIKLNGSFTFKINDVNEGPIEIRVYGGGVVIENSPTGTEIGNLNTVDPEPYQTYTYRLLSVANGLDVSKSKEDLYDVFVLEKSTLKVGPGAKALDFEQNPTWSLLVQTTDSGSPPLGLNYTVRIIVENANDAPINVSLTSNTVPEDAKIKRVVGKLKVDDPDNGQNHRCIVNNLQDVPFNIENGLDLVVSQADLDYEFQRQYVVEVTCEDDGADGSHLKITAPMFVFVLNVNEPPHNITLSKLEIEEGNDIGALVAVIEAHDPDSKETFFSIDENAEDNWKDFTIKGDGSLTTNTVFDFEKKSSYSVTIVAKDEEDLTYKQTFSIKITDKNEQPTAISLTNNVIDENAKRGTLIGYFRTDDPDQKQTFFYKLSEKSGTTGNFVILGDRLEVGENNLDHEEDDVHVIIVTSLDNGNPPLQLKMEFNIQIKNKNEAPTEIIIKEPISVEENVAQQTNVVTITVRDEEPDQSHACSVLTSPVPFKIQTSDSGKLQLVVGGLIDFEKKQSYDLNISCSDGEFSIYKAITVEVKNLNEPPTRIYLLGPQALPASITSRYVVGKLVVDDEDIGQSHIFTTSGSNSDILKVEGKNQLVMIKNIPKDILDKPNPQMNITVTVMDGGADGKPFVQILSLPITGIDLELLKLPEITLDNTEIDEETLAGSKVGEIFDRNEVVSDHVIFSIIKDELDMFELNGRFIVLTKNISLSTPNSVELSIQAINKETQETKERTVTFIISRSDKCWKQGQVCHDDARCVLVDETHYKCQCKTDFQGNGYSCEQIDDCVGDIEEKCGHHGDCIDDVNSFVCKCIDGYTGKNCDQPPPSANPCYKNNCKNNAACKVNQGEKNYTCVCAPGWTGDHCTISIDECKLMVEPCLGKGECIDGHLSYSCNCSKERYGQKCNFFKNSCVIGSCTPGTVCIPKVDIKDKACVYQNGNNTFTIQVKCDLGNSRGQCINKFIYVFERKMQYLTKELIMYEMDVKDGPDGYIIVTFIVTDRTYHPLTTKQIVDHFEEVCKSEDEIGTIETEYCPKVMKAIDTFKKAQDKDPDGSNKDGNDNSDGNGKNDGDDGNRSCSITSFSFGGVLFAGVWIIASLLY